MSVVYGQLVDNWPVEQQSMMDWVGLADSISSLLDQLRCDGDPKEACGR